MSVAIEPDRIATGLSSFLTDRWGRRVEVTVLSQASAGARRQNVLVDVADRGEITPMVATIEHNLELTLLSVEDQVWALRRAEAAGVPAPHVYEHSEDPTYVGGPFYLAARIDGETVPRRVIRLVEGSGPDAGARVARQIGDAAGRLHRAEIEPGEVPEALLRLPHLTPSAAALERVQEEYELLLQPSPVFALVLRWLERNQPDEPTRRVLLHGDLRTGNMVVGPDGLRALLDWEGSHVGDPIEDLGWLSVRIWRFRNDHLEAGGLGARQDLFGAYADATGEPVDEERYHWWKVLGTLRWGTGLAKQARQHLLGEAPSIVMAASGRRVCEMEYDALMLLRHELGVQRGRERGEREWTSRSQPRSRHC